MITMKLKVVGKIDGGAMSKSNLLALAKIIVIDNSNFVEVF
jgi:hypothetical protein